MRVVILPELGGRIHIGYDKVAGYDFFYRNNVIKPALVGLAGPWISRRRRVQLAAAPPPATFLPTDCDHRARSRRQRSPSGAPTTTRSTRMKGMHGIRLRPDSAVIELRVRSYNRTTRRRPSSGGPTSPPPSHDDYQSFFPADVDHVADHAKRATATLPGAPPPRGRYYGVDYPAQRAGRCRRRPPATGTATSRCRPPTWSSGPTATSSAATTTAAGRLRALGRPHSPPGKKQWTWGEPPFGHAWDGASPTTTAPTSS